MSVVRVAFTGKGVNIGWLWDSGIGGVAGLAAVSAYLATSVRLVVCGWLGIFLAQCSWFVNASNKPMVGQGVSERL